MQLEGSIEEFWDSGSRISSFRALEFSVEKTAVGVYRMYTRIDQACKNLAVEGTEVEHNMSFWGSTP